MADSPKSHREHADRPTQRRHMRAALAVTGVVLVAELIGGLLSGSLALLADAGHMFTDTSALLLAYAAMTLAERGASKRYTFGFYRAEILAAFINAQVLFLVGVFILWEAFARFQDPRPIDTSLMLAVAVVGLVANLISMRFLHDHQHGSLNVRAAYLEVLTDAFGSAAVVVAALVIRPTGWLWLDPLVSVAIALFILPRAVGILRQAGHVLLEGTPRHVDLADVRTALLELPGVCGIHDFHCWTLTSGVDSASVHVTLEAGSERLDVRLAVTRIIRDRVGIEHVTVQVEEASEADCGAAAHH